MITVPLSARRRCFTQRGSALIMVIFLITVLYMIVHAMHEIVIKDVNLAMAQQQAFRARQVGEMGINWAMNPAVKPYDRDILDQTLEDGSTFSVKIRGEGGRMNINALLQKLDDPTSGVMVRDFMKNLFHLWGIEDTQEADDLLNNLLDWTDADSASHHNGMEKDNYVQIHGDNTPYPFNRPFYSLEEMLLVPGFERIVAWVPDWRDYFTIYSRGQVDVNSAEPKVLAAVTVAIKDSPQPQEEFAEMMEPGGTAETAVALRWGDDEIEDTEDDKPLENAQEMISMLGLPSGSDDPEAQLVSQLFGINDPTTHIECVATVGDYRKRVILIVRGRTGQPQILSREEVPF